MLRRQALVISVPVSLQTGWSLLPQGSALLQGVQTGDGLKF